MCNLAALVEGQLELESDPEERFEALAPNQFWSETGSFLA